MNSPPHILVATDGSPTAQHAVAWAAEFAQATGAEVVLAHAMARSGEWLVAAAQIDFVRLEKERRDFLDGAWSEPLRAAGVKYQTKFLVGDPVKSILDAADDEDADFIVIGKVGHGHVGEFFIGGDAAKISHRATRPLLMVPPAT